MMITMVFLIHMNMNTLTMMAFPIFSMAMTITTVFLMFSTMTMMVTESLTTKKILMVTAS